MKIALAHRRLDLGGGTERDFYRTAEGLRDLGHEVHLFCSEFKVSAPEGTRAHGVPLVPLGRTARLWSFALLAPRVIARHRCDVVAGFGRMVGQDIVRSGGGSHRVFLEKMARGEGKLRRLWHRLSPYHRSVLAVERRQYAPGNYRKVLAVSREVKREIASAYQVPEEKIAVLYNGVDTDRFHPRHRDRARARVRGQWGIPLEAPLALFVGNGFKRKGLDRLARVWESRDEGIYLLVVGADHNERGYRALTGRAKGKIVFAGPQERVEEYYGAADLFLLPAFQEAFGNVVLEALASGIPVIVTRAVGAAEVLAGELKEGILENPDDPEEIRAKMLGFLEPGRRFRLSQQARKLAEAYSWKNHFRRLEDELLSVAGRHGP